ncbi:MAG: hypothetical protein K8R87_07390 [Verrucomicrobia bacterium]|nr:hypothetical protein [Verrucomicrobiota bacterium]
MAKAETKPKSRAPEIAKWVTNKAWRMNNLYLILTGEGEKTAIKPFRVRPEQDKYYRDRHSRNFCPKSRKVGMSTAIVLDYLDECIFAHPDRPVHAAHVDFKEDDAYAKLKIAKLAWDKGPEHPDPIIAGIWKALHERNPLVTSNAGELVWTNGSKQQAGTSFMGGSPLRLHISEYGPMSVKFPLKAEEIKQGTFNSLLPGGIIDVETTMRGGMFGACSAIFQLALKTIGESLTPLDWKMHFIPWYGHPDYNLPGETPKKDATMEYFDSIELSDGVKLPPSRMAWYEAKKAEQGSKMFTEFPTVVRECLYAGSDVNYFEPDGLQWMRDQITSLEPQIEYYDLVVQGDVKDFERRSVSLVKTGKANAPFMIIERPLPGRRYLIFADTCVGKQAKGSDDSKRDTHAYGVMRAAHFDVESNTHFKAQIVAACKMDDTNDPDDRSGDRCPTTEFIRRVVALSIYYGDCMVAPEINNKDDIALRLISAGVRNMYKQGSVGADGALPGEKETSEVWGWLTNEGTRRQMLDHMQMETIQKRWICSFPGILKQMGVFIVNAKGRAEAAPGEHDDWVTGPAIGLFLVGHHGTRYVDREELLMQQSYQRDWNALNHAHDGI